jgi:hypothetical protein
MQCATASAVNTIVRGASTNYHVTTEEFDQPVRVAAVMRELLAAHDIVLTQPASAERVLRLAPELGRRMELFFRPS